MKKTYINPSTTIVKLSATNSILTASRFNSTLNSTNGDDGSKALIKEDYSSQQDYNVWDDDWSR